MASPHIDISFPKQDAGCTTHPIPAYPNSTKIFTINVVSNIQTGVDENMYAYILGQHPVVGHRLERIAMPSQCSKIRSNAACTHMHCVIRSSVYFGM